MEGVGLEMRAFPQGIDFWICFVYPRTLYNEAFELVRNRLQITKVSMKVITKSTLFVAHNDGNNTLEL